MSETPGYYSNVNESLLAAIPPNSRRVLEVGCGTGALASRFKLINPRCIYKGVEADREASELAKMNRDVDIFPGPIEHFLPQFAKSKARWDTVVAGDVLEHLIDPLSVLKKCVELLEPGGSVVACIPNIQYWGAICTLIEGDWPQHESGIFDATHLRWFTKKTMVEMFEAAGLSISKVVARNVFPGGQRLVDAVRTFGLASDPKRFSEDSQALQFIVHGIKGDLPSRRVLIRGFAAEACCARPRLTEPGAFLNTIPGVRYSETPTEVQPGESVVVVRQRFNIDDAAVREHLKHGHLVVGEWDDDPWHEGFKARLKVPVEWALKACHVVTVSTNAIAELVRPINPNVVVIPNQIAAVGPEREYVASDVVRVYMGGQRSREDWIDAVAVVNEIVAEAPDRYHFVIVHDRDLYGALETKHKTFYAFQPYEKYRALLRTCDVALMPLADTRFNRCKSDITEIECEAEGVVHMQYATEIDIDPSELSGFPDVRGEVVADRMLCDHYMHRHELINKWLDDKTELDRQLFERLPELKEES